MTDQPPGYGPPPPGYGWPQGYGWAPPPGWRPPAPQPGAVPLRPLGTSEILDGAFRLLRRNPRVMLGLSALVSLVGALINTVATTLSFRTLDRVNLTDVNNNGDSNVGALLGNEGVQLISVVAGVLVGALLTGMLTVAITQDVLGVRMSAAQVWRRVRPRLGAIVGISLLTTILEVVGLLLLIGPGIWLWGIWAVAVPAMMVEDLGVGRALSRSRALVRGTFWRVWGVRALGYLVVTLLGGLLSAPFSVAALFLAGTFDGGSTGHSLVLPVVLTAIGQVIVGTVTTPIRCGVDALLYVDLRMRKEGLDIQLQMAAQQLATGTAGPATTIADAAF